MKIKELIKKATEALHGAIKGQRRSRAIVFDSIKDLSDALIRAKEAHSEFEHASGAKDYNWPLWYAAYIAMEARVAGKISVQTRHLGNRSFARFRKCATA